MNFKLFYFFIKKLTLKKIFNALKVYLSYLSSVIFKTSVRPAYPVSISVEPTASCNLKCPECPVGNESLDRYSGNIDINLYKKILDEMSPFISNIILYFQGEPFLNNQIFEITEYASIKKRVFTVTSTNGHFLTEENCKKIINSGLDKIIISVDGSTQETYEKYRKNGNLDAVISGIKNLVRQKKIMKSAKPVIVMQFIVFKFNQHQIKDIKKTAKTLNIDKLEIKSAQIYDFEKNSFLIPDINKYSRYKKKDNGTFEIKNKLKNKCRRLWESAVITNNGDVLPCCFDKNAKYKFGNLKNNDFKQINNNQKALNFRKAVLKNRKEIDICSNCTEGLIK